MLTVVRDVVARLPVEHVFFALLIAAGAAFAYRVICRLSPAKLTKIQRYRSLKYSLLVFVIALVLALTGVLLHQSLAYAQGINHARAEAQQFAARAMQERDAANQMAKALAEKNDRQLQMTRVVGDIVLNLDRIASAGFIFDQQWRDELRTFVQSPTRRGQLEILELTLAEARPQVATDAQRSSFAELNREVGTIHLFRRDYSAAVERFREVLSIPSFEEDVDARDKLLESLEGAPSSANSEERRALRTELRELAKRDDVALLVELSCQLEEAIRDEKLETAVQLAPRAAHLAHKLGRQHSELELRLRLCWVLARSARVAEAKQIVENIAPRIVSGSDAVLLSSLAAARRAIAEAEGNWAEAVRVTEVQRSLERKLGRPLMEIAAHLTLAELKSKLGNHESAEADRRAAEELKRNLANDRALEAESRQKTGG